MILIRRIIAIAALPGLISCGGAHSRQLLQPAHPADPAQLLSSVPALPMPHAGAGLGEASVDGGAVYDKSTGAVVNDPVLELSAPAGQVCWGIWELPALDELRYLDLSLSIDDGEEAYLAVADYSRGVWDITGPVYSRRVLELDPVKHASPGPSLYVLVLVYDRQSAAVNKLTLVAMHANAAPVAALDALPLSGAAPLTVVFDASASADPDAGIVRYLWDFDEDGLFEATGYTPAASHIYTLPGLVDAIVAAEGEFRWRQQQRCGRFNC